MTTPNSLEARKSFYQAFGEACVKQKRDEKLWIKLLRERGIRATHPDDGWVNRQRNWVTLTYPQFNAGVTVGDLMALGRPDEYRIVKIIGQHESPLGLKYLWFSDHE